MIEDTKVLVILALLISSFSWLFHITYESIKQWAWSDVKRNKKDPR